MDYGLVNAAGELTAQPFSYRDDRSRAAVARVHQKLDPARLYATTGLQFLQFNTIYQLATEPDLDGLQALLIPDLIAFLLTGVSAAPRPPTPPPRGSSTPSRGSGPPSSSPPWACPKSCSRR